MRFLENKLRETFGFEGTPIIIKCRQRSLKMTVISILISYLIGSFSVAYVVVKLLKGIDIRTVGSRNAGRQM